jgi:teichuronic acid biosynthesis glycosyltransferase TuaC
LKLLLVVPSYPWSAGLFAGVFNQRCAHALRDLGAHVEVLAPRPYSPKVLGLLRPKWRAYLQIPRTQEENGVAVHRPSFVQIPRFASTFWREAGASASCRRIVEERHERIGFDAILAFDLLGGGGLGWRLGRRLGIFAAGWATGDDVRVGPGSAAGRALTRTLHNLDLVFYQSRELAGIAAERLGAGSGALDPGRHVVLSRGIAEPPPEADRRDMRIRARARLGLAANETMVLSVGRIDAHKGVFEILKAAARLSAGPEFIRVVLVGSVPGFDETPAVQRFIASHPALGSRVQVLPSCPPPEVWQYLAAADIFAFTSHKEGMPNSLLEAMAMDLPVAAFGIPPVVEIDAGAGVVLQVPPFDVDSFAKALRELAGNPEERRRRGAGGSAIVRTRFSVRTNMALALNRLDEGVRPDRLKAVTRGF